MIGLLAGLYIAIPLRAQTTRPVWEVMDLPSVRGERVTIYYDKTLDGDPQAAVASYERFVASRKSSPIEGREADILRDINAIVGIPASPELAKSQQTLLGLIHGFRGMAPPTICFLKMSTIKSYLEGGGQIPQYSYNAQEKRATFKFEASLGEQPASELVMPAGDSASLPEAVSQFERMIVEGVPTVPMTIHELTEAAILRRLRPKDQYYRWFSDGFANAITERLVRKYLGDAEADRFAAAYDTAKYAEIQHEINLTYWRGLAAAVKTSLEIETRIDYARYCYSMLEAKRLLDAHGIEIVAKIMEKAAPDEHNDTRRLFDAVKEVTGEDLRARFTEQYQTFATADDGKAVYKARIEQADAKKDNDGLLAGHLRLRELYEGGDVRTELLTIVLVQMRGEQDVSDELFDRIRKSAEAPENRAARQAINEAYVAYCLASRRFAAADKAADEVQVANPYHLPSLHAKMLRQVQLGKLDDAGKFADQILANDFDSASQHVKAAREVKARQQKASPGKPSENSPLDGIRIGL
jgi:hypothetical protein